MPETLLLAPIRDGLTGTVRLDAGPEALYLRISLTLSAPLPDSDVLKVYLLSSNSRQAEPFRAGLIEPMGTSGQFEAEYRKTTVFSPEIYDSVAVIQKNVFTDTVFLKAAAFAGKSWDIGTPFGDPRPELEPQIAPQAEMPAERLGPEPELCPAEHPEAASQIPAQPQPAKTAEQPEAKPEPSTPLDTEQLSEIHRLLDELHRNEAYRAFLALSEEIQDPVERAVNALQAIKELRKTQSAEPNIHLWYKQRLHQKLQAFQQVKLPAETGFTWYRIDYPTPLVALSAFQHVLFHPQVLQAISWHRYYLLGEHPDRPLYCLAIPVAQHAPNPLMHIDDCCVFLRSGHPELDYSTVCISLEEDGQYYLPLGEDGSAKTDRATCSA